MNRKALVREAMQAAADAREAVGLDQFSPADPCTASAKLGVKVVFLRTSMEGFYFKGPPPKILLSALRPVPRRAFTCAHEIGHHWFKHGSTIDQLQADDRTDSSKPEEVMANAFAASFLMPTPAVRGAYARRKWSPMSATPLQHYIVSCEFGVGYQTLLTHLAMLGEISKLKHEELEKWTPQRIRRQILPAEYESLLIVDEHSEAKTCDVEKGAAVLIPHGSEVDGRAISQVQRLGEFDLYIASKRGSTSIAGSPAAIEVRVMPKEYEGPASNRFLEDPDEDG